MAGNVVDYGFYLIQRGEAGHMRGAILNEYKDSGGIETIGYGTVTRPGYNSLNYRNKTVTEELAVDLAKTEMAQKINEKCRLKFKDFDNLLPCYQAAILDMAYQGSWESIQNAMNAHDMQSVYETIIFNQNKERAAVRGRAIEMGILIEQAKKEFPDLDPKKLAQLLAEEMIEKYKELNGTDCELTKDELALLYRSCMMAYGKEVTDEEVEQFALSYSQVATGFAGIGSTQMAQPFNGIISAGPAYDGSIAVPQARGGMLAYNGNGGGRGGSYFSGQSLTPSHLFYDNKPFQADSSKLKIDRRFSSPNRNSRNGMNPQMIVIHSTESSSLASTINTFQSHAAQTSAHYVVDRDGSIYQMVPENERANHAGRSMWAPLGIDALRGCNAASIGIEIQRSPNEGYTPEQIASTMALVKDIQDRRGISPANTVGHADIAQPLGRKVDPGDDFPWDAFEREGLAYGKSHHRGGDHAQHYFAELNKICASDCAFYKDEPLEEKIKEQEPVYLADADTDKLHKLVESLSEASLAGDEKEADVEKKKSSGGKKGSGGAKSKLASASNASGNAKDGAGKSSEDGSKKPDTKTLADNSEKVKEIKDQMDSILKKDNPSKTA